MNTQVSPRSRVSNASALRGRLANSEDIDAAIAKAKAIIAVGQSHTIPDTSQFRLMRPELRIRLRKDSEMPPEFLRSIGDFGQMNRAVSRLIKTDGKIIAAEVIDGEKRLAGVRVHGLPFKTLVIRCDDDDLIPFIIALAANEQQEPLTIMEKSRALAMLRDTWNCSLTTAGRIAGYTYGLPYLETLYRLQRLSPEARKYADDATTPEGGRKLTVDVLGAIAGADPSAHGQWAKVAHKERLTAAQLNERMRSKGDKPEAGGKARKRDPIAAKDTTQAVTLADQIAAGVAGIEKFLEHEKIPGRLSRGHPFLRMMVDLDAAEKGIARIRKKLGIK